MDKMSIDQKRPIYIYNSGGAKAKMLYFELFRSIIQQYTQLCTNYPCIASCMCCFTSLCVCSIVFKREAWRFSIFWITVSSKVYQCLLFTAYSKINTEP